MPGELGGLAAAANLLGHMNVWMGDFEKYNQSSAAHVPESGIRFKLYTEPNNPNDPYGGIFFHESDSLYNLGYDNNTPNNLKTAFTEYNQRVLDIFFVEQQNNPTDSMAVPFTHISGSAPGIGALLGSAIVAGMYSDHIFDTSNYNGGERDIVNYKSVAVHEILHNLGLHHSFVCVNECRFVDLNTEADCNTPGEACSVFLNGNSTPGVTGGCAGRSTSPTNNIMRHGVTATAITPCQLGIIQYHLLVNQPGYLEFDFCELSEPDIIIHTGEHIVWKSTRYLRSNLIIENGASLTIRCLVGMPKGSVIRVKPGGKLIVDEGEVTNPCGETWQGIEVIGNPNTHQYFASQQGVVELKNGAIIEYAEIGVSLFERGNAAQTSGGILRVDSAEFSDNRWGVVFYNYAFLLNGVELDNRSYIYNGAFKLTAQYPFDEFFAHAYVGFVNGVDFWNCTFEDERPAGQLTNDYQLARGIRSEGARFSARACRFDSLLYGIDANGFGEARNFTARECVFTGCYVGISIRGVDYAYVYDSHFAIGGYNRPVDSGIDFPALHSGIFVDRSSNFGIEKNAFEPQAGALNTTIGITAKDTNLPEGSEGQHVDYNEIYNNTFAGLDIGNLANGNNLGAFIGGGLTYLCNQNANTAFSNDIRVDQGSIASHQIDPGNFAAGNIFTPCESGLTHIDNLLGNSIRYYYWAPGANEEPVCSPEFKVTRIPDDQNLCSEGGEIPDEVVASHLQLFHAFKEEFQELDNYYQSLLDNGDKPGVLNMIESTTPANGAARQGQLLAYSPFLSQASALAVLAQQHFTAAQKKDILAANPELLYRDAIWNAILADTTFSHQQLSELEQARATSSPRDSLEREMASTYGALHRAGNKLIRHYQGDTAGVALDSVRLLLAEKLSLEAAYQNVDAFLQARDTASAMQGLSAIPDSFALSEAQLQEHAYYKQLKQLQAALVADNRGWQDISAQEKALVQAVADNSLGRAAVQVENILMAVDGGNQYYHNPIITVGQQLRAQPPRQQEERAAMARQRLVEVFPNPARGSVQFRCRLPEGTEGAFLSLFNPAGSLLTAFHLAESQNQLSWDTTPLPAGLYYYRLLLPNGQAETGKFAVMK